MSRVRSRNTKAQNWAVKQIVIGFVTFSVLNILSTNLSNTYFAFLGIAIAMFFFIRGFSRIKKLYDPKVITVFSILNKPDDNILRTGIQIATVGSLAMLIHGSIPNPSLELQVFYPLAVIASLVLITSAILKMMEAYYPKESSYAGGLSNISNSLLFIGLVMFGVWILYILGALMGPKFAASLTPS